MRRFVRWYGSDPLHLAAMVTCFALAGYAAPRLLSSESTAVAVWFLGAVIGHDLLLLPLYTLAERPLTALARRRPQPWSAGSVNYVRVPAGVATLLLLVWFPLIFRLPDSYHSITGRSTENYLERWLLITAALFAVSSFTLALRLRRDRRTRIGRADDRRAFR
ncbi:MAG: hypothetical protein M3179_08595 [Actinomycetota bacterium]|nr:hypothetical protein [Actinomycetota bacterium]